MKLLSKGFWFFTWDLKSGYHHVDIFRPHEEFLGLAWDFDGVVRYFTSGAPNENIVQNHLT